jgi:hypothetical protein
MTLNELQRSVGFERDERKEIGDELEEKWSWQILRYYLD